MTINNPLLGSDVKMNQFRNAIYELILVLRKEKEMSDEELINELKDMGHSIFNTYKRYWYPKETEPLDIIQEIHSFIFKKKVKLEYVDPESPKTSDIFVKDKKCCFCKYPRPDVGRIAGCHLIEAVIESYFKQLHEKNPRIPVIHGEVMESKTFGDKNCVHVYRRMEGS